MANFSGKINLLGFKNAQLMTGIDPDHPAMLHTSLRQETTRSLAAWRNGAKI